MKTFKKSFISEKKLEKEVYFLEKLSMYDYFPKIINIDKQNKQLEMSFCGEVLKKGQNPSGWKSQLTRIIEILEKENIYHNDMHWGNFIIMNGKIFLIDFGSASENDEDFPFHNVKSSSLKSCDSFIHFLFKAVQNERRMRRKNWRRY